VNKNFKKFDTLILFARCQQAAELLMGGDDDEMFMTRSLNVTPKATEQNVIVCTDKCVSK